MLVQWRLLKAALLICLPDGKDPSLIKYIIYTASKLHRDKIALLDFEDWVSGFPLSGQLDVLLNY